MSPTALITGSTGFIGTHITEQWPGEPHPEWIRVDRKHGYDLSKPGWTTALPDETVDLVLHFAQSRRYRDFPDGSDDMFGVNVGSTAELLEWSRKHQVRRFILASTGTVYTPGSNPCSESAGCSPASMFAASKFSAEILARPYSQLFDVVVARLFAVYGPGGKQNVISRMFESIASGREIELAGGDGFVTSPLFVTDCVRALAALSVARLDSYFLVNVAGNETCSLGSIVEQIGTQMGKSPNTRLTSGVPLVLTANVTRLERHYSDFTSVADGIRATAVARARLTCCTEG